MVWFGTVRCSTALQGKVSQINTFVERILFPVVNSFRKNVSPSMKSSRMQFAVMLPLECYRDCMIATDGPLPARVASRSGPLKAKAQKLSCRAWQVPLSPESMFADVEENFNDARENCTFADSSVHNTEFYTYWRAPNCVKLVPAVL